MCRSLVSSSDVVIEEQQVIIDVTDMVSEVNGEGPNSNAQITTNDVFFHVLFVSISSFFINKKMYIKSHEMNTAVSRLQPIYFYF